MAKFVNLDNWKDMPVPEPQNDEYKEVAWGIKKCGEKFSPLYINRPNVGETDLKIDMHFCGICHTDVTLGLNTMGGCMYPIVPGHELAGIVSEVGSKVTKFKVGDKVGVGCMVDSCLNCDACEQSEE